MERDNMPFYYYSPVLLEPLPADGKPAIVQTGLLNSLYGAFLQAFTVDDVFARKIK
jgi:hypothetical protein